MPDRVVVNGVDFHGSTPVATVVSALGKPTRTEGGKNPHLIAYDDFGIEVRCDAQAGTVDTFILYFGTPPDRPGTPTSHYRGKVRVGRATLDASTRLDDAGRLLIQQGAEHISRLAFGVWNLRFGRFTVSFEQLEAVTLETMWVELTWPGATRTPCGDGRAGGEEGQ